MDDTTDVDAVPVEIFDTTGIDGKGDSVVVEDRTEPDGKAELFGETAVVCREGRGLWLACKTE